MASGFRLAYPTTVPFGRHIGVSEKLEIVIENRSLVLMSVTPFAVTLGVVAGSRLSVRGTRGQLRWIRTVRPCGTPGVS